MEIVRKAFGVGALVLALVGCGNDVVPKKPVSNRPVYSSYGMDLVMQGKSSREILSDWQVEREKEWNRRDSEFYRCDRNKDGVLTGEEAKEYCALPIFNYRFR